jgi:hypothetical protein
VVVTRADRRVRRRTHCGPRWRGCRRRSQRHSALLVRRVQWAAAAAAADGRCGGAGTCQCPGCHVPLALSVATTVDKDVAQSVACCYGWGWDVAVGVR